MKDTDYNWEAAGSLTPELEGTPHSGVHKKRAARKTENLPDNVMSKKDAKRLERGVHVPDLNSIL